MTKYAPAVASDPAIESRQPGQHPRLGPTHSVQHLPTRQSQSLAQYLFTQFTQQSHRQDRVQST